MLNENKPLTHKVYESVYRDIINGAITCNDLVTEAGISKSLEVSKAPVREALLMLCEEQILQSIPRMGYKVLMVTPPQVAKLTESRALLEPYLLGKAWNQLGDVQIMQVKKLLQHQTQNPSDTVYDFWNGNIQFHLLLSGFADNQYLQKSLSHVMKMYSLVAAQYFMTATGRQKTAHDYHTIIVQGLCEHDFDKAMNALKADIYEML